MAVTEKTEARLGGFPLIGGESFSWPLREGTEPVVMEFTMAPDDAKQLKKKIGPFTLEITPPEGKGIKAEFLYVIGVGPGINPYESKVRVADRRYWWSYPHVLRRHNIRRSVGTKRVLANDQFAVPFDRADEIQFWAWSLNGGNRWHPLLALMDIFKEVADTEGDRFGHRFSVKVEDTIGSRLKALPYENVEVDDPGNAALMRVLEYLKGAGVYVDLDGTVVVYDRASGREKEIVQALMPELWGEGHTDLVENDNIRPSEIHYLFTRHVEVRFDFIELTLGAVGVTVVEGEASPLGRLRRMENVLPIPDYQLLVRSVDSTRQLAQGNWITMDQAFQSWGNLPFEVAKRPLDHDLVQMSFIPKMDLWSALQLSGQAPDANDNNDLKPWIARLAEVEKHYRQTFRIATEWRDRMLQISEYRIAITNPQTGQRAPARAYGDYAVMYTHRSIWRNAAQGKPLTWAINRSAFPSIDNPLDKDAEPSPAIVSILDNDQGIIRIDYSGHHPLTGDTRTILPSQIEGEGFPTADFTNRTAPVAWNSITDSNNPPRLTSTYNLSIVLTCVPAAPNTDQQLQRVVVKPSDVSDLMPGHANKSLQNCRGPIMEIRVGANIEVARVQWKDDRAVDIERCFGLENGSETTALPNLTDLVINEGSATDLATGGSINLIARAGAARIYSALVDRYEGSMTGYMNGNVKPAGWVSEVEHIYGAQAEATTRVIFPGEIPQMPLASFLDASTRAAIFRLVKPENA